MRNIQISTDVFQAIWAARKPGEEEEDSILRRVLGVGKGESISSTGQNSSRAFVDPSYGVVFPDKFEIFRTYLGKEYRARVENGRWVVDGQATNARTINQLSSAIGIQTENGWANWEYLNPAGQIQKIGGLRDRSLIRRRKRARL